MKAYWDLVNNIEGNQPETMWTNETKQPKEVGGLLIIRWGENPVITIIIDPKTFLTNQFLKKQEQLNEIMKHKDLLSLY